jgi:hypothetical protein
MARSALIVALALLVPALAASPAGAQAGGKLVFTGGYIYHSERIPPGATVKFDVTCPPGFRAVAGTVSTGDRDVLQLLSTPIGVPPFRVWKFGFRNTDTELAITITVMVTCAKPRLPVGVKVGKKVNGVLQITPLYVPPRKTKKKVVTCPPGQAPAGDTQQVITPTGPRAAGAGQPAIAVRGVRARGAGIETTVENVGQVGATVRLGALCLPKQVALRDRNGDDSTMAIRVTPASVGFRFGAGTGGVRTGCPSGFPVDAGYTVPAGVDFLGAAFGLRTPQVALGFANGTGHPISGQVHLVCFRDGRATFARGVAQQIDTVVGPITIR